MFGRLLAKNASLLDNVPQDLLAALGSDEVVSDVRKNSFFQDFGPDSEPRALLFPDAQMTAAVVVAVLVDARTIGFARGLELVAGVTPGLAADNRGGEQQRSRRGPSRIPLWVPKLSNPLRHLEQFAIDNRFDRL
jgi:hypothetical protein